MLKMSIRPKIANHNTHFVLVRMPRGSYYSDVHHITL